MTEHLKSFKIRKLNGEPGTDDPDKIIMNEGMLEIIHEKIEIAKGLSKRNSMKASKPRKQVTKRQLVKHQSDFEAEHGTTRGSVKAACIEFEIDSKTWKKRMAE